MKYGSFLKQTITKILIWNHSIFEKPEKSDSKTYNFKNFYRESSTCCIFISTQLVDFFVDFWTVLQKAQFFVSNFVCFFEHFRIFHEEMLVLILTSGNGFGFTSSKIPIVFPENEI